MSVETLFSQEELVREVKLAGLWQQLSSQLTKQKIINEVTADMGITVTPEEIQKAADTFRRQTGLIRSKDMLDWLQERKLSVEDLEINIRHQILKQKLSQHLFAERVEPYFVENLQQYQGAIMSQILLGDYNLAQEIFEEISTEKISFVVAAERYIENPETKRMGGYLGLIMRPDMLPEIANIVFAAKSAGLLEPVKSQNGIHIIFLHELIQLELTPALRGEIMERLLQEWLEKQST